MWMSGREMTPKTYGEGEFISVIRIKFSHEWGCCAAWVLLGYFNSVFGQFANTLKLVVLSIVLMKVWKSTGLWRAVQNLGQNEINLLQIKNPFPLIESIYILKGWYFYYAESMQCHTYPLDAYHNVRINPRDTVAKVPLCTPSWSLHTCDINRYYSKSWCSFFFTLT